MYIDVEAEIISRLKSLDEYKKSKTDIFPIFVRQDHSEEKFNQDYDIPTQANYRDDRCIDTHDLYMLDRRDFL